MTPILEVRNVTKRFPGVLANDRVSFSLREGEILAFLGENGAGKSTLMNILYGLYAQDEGEVEVRGTPVEVQDPNDAIELGIGMVHQHFQLVPVFTVAENIVMGTEPTRFSFSWQTLGLDDRTRSVPAQAEGFRRVKGGPSSPAAAGRIRVASPRPSIPIPRGRDTVSLFWTQLGVRLFDFEVRCQALQRPHQ